MKGKPETNSEHPKWTMKKWEIAGNSPFQFI